MEYSPINLPILSKLLSVYLDREAAYVLCNGFRYGFSIKSLTLPFIGDDKFVITRIPPVFLGTSPMGDTLKFEIGRYENGPAIR
jgi:hypothetical protein